jgi:hypothetical protein
MGLGVYKEELFSFAFLKYVYIVKFHRKCKLISGLRRTLRNKCGIIPAGDSYRYLSPLNFGG